MKNLFILSVLFLLACKGGSDSVEEKEIESPPQPKKESIHMVVSYGQSNAAGSSYSPELAPDVPESWGVKWMAWSGAEVDLTEPTRQDKMVRGSQWSSYANRFHELTGDKVAVVNIAHGGKRIHELSTGSYHGDLSFTWFAEAYQHFSTEYDLKSVSIVWLQGESDAIDMTNVDDYFASLEDIKKEFKSLVPESEFYTVRVGYNSSHNSDQIDYAFNLGSDQVKRSEKPVYVKTPSFHKKGLMSDTVHYTQEAYNSLGYEIANNIHSYINGIDISSQIKQESAQMDAYNPN